MQPADTTAALLRRLYASALCMDAGFFLVLAALPFKVIALGGGPLALGAVPAISSVTYILLTLIAGRQSDRVGRFGMSLWGCGCFAAFCGLAHASRQLGALALAMPLLGTGAALYWPAAQAAVGDLAGPAGLARAIGRFNVAWGLGKGAGFLLGGMLLAGPGFGAAFGAGAALVAASFLMLPRGRALPPAVRTAHRAASVDSAVPAATGAVFRRMAWLANFGAFGAAGVLNHQLPKWFAAAGWGEARFGGLLGAVFLTQAGAFLLLAGRVRFAWSVKRLLVPQIAAALAMAAVPLAPGWGALLAIAPLLGGAFGVCYAASIYYSLHTPAGRGRNAGIHESLIGAANFAVPLAAGAASRATGQLALPYPLAAAVMGVVVAAQATLSRRLPKGG